MDARNTSLDWPCQPTIQNVVMWVAVVTGLPNGPWLSGWIKSDIWAPAPLPPPFLGLLPLGAPQPNDVTEEESLDPQCMSVWFEDVCVCVCGFKVASERERGEKSEYERPAEEMKKLTWFSKHPPKQVLVAPFSTPSVSTASSSLRNSRVSYLSSQRKMTTVLLNGFSSYLISNCKNTPHIGVMHVTI